MHWRFLHKFCMAWGKYNKHWPKSSRIFTIQAVKRKAGCSRRIRSDMGTEIPMLSKCIFFLDETTKMRDEMSGPKSFLYGKITYNQRIEWFWGCLRKKVGQFWMDVFKGLSNDTVDISFCDSFLDKSLVPYSFIKLI